MLRLKGSNQNPIPNPRQGAVRAPGIKDAWAGSDWQQRACQVIAQLILHYMGTWPLLPHRAPFEAGDWDQVVTRVFIVVDINMQGCLKVNGSKIGVRKRLKHKPTKQARTGWKRTRMFPEPSQGTLGIRT